jgi:iron complex transport system ATP-binding protein
MFRFQNCVIGYQSVLFSIDELSLVSGNVYALFGANGTGKSTFLHKLALGGFQKNTVAFDEHEWEQYTVKQRTKLLTLIDNKFQGQHFMNTKEYLALGRFPYTGYLGSLSPNDEKIIAHYAEELCLEHLFDKSTATLSDGERQRATIAKALIQETPILLFDEPTSFLDYPTKRNVMQMIQTIAKKFNKIVVIAAHDLELCTEFSDQLLLIDPIKKRLRIVNEPLTIPEIVAIINPN